MHEPLASLSVTDWVGLVLNSRPNSTIADMGTDYLGAAAAAKEEEKEEEEEEEDEVHTKPTMFTLAF